jgi:polysaccharide pyruvyl transferase WcaK-like protein
VEKNKIKIFHFCLSSPVGNFGDDVLFLATKDAFEGIFRDQGVEWVNYPLRNHTTDNVIDKANSCDLVVVGGGGLILKDTNPNEYSGWQWACSLKHLEMIKKPLIVYSIGYNRFRGQGEFDEIFFEHMRMTVERATRFFVRNTGSKRALLAYSLPEDKILVNPCPSLFYKSGKKRGRRRRGSTRVGVNLAGDRSNLRFKDKSRFYNNLQRALRALVGRGCELYFFNHSWNPESNCQDFIDGFDGPKVVYDVETVWNRGDIDRVITLYRGMDLVMAMRGHSQMIPFGQCVKVISLISHNKLKWFLEDVGMEDTGIEVNDGDLPKKLTVLVNELLESEDYYYRQMKALKKLRRIFASNNRSIKEGLGL